jgi:prohibitin 2
MDVRTQKYEAPATAASKDLQVVTATIATNYHIVPEQSPSIFSTLGLGYAETIIKPVEQESVKAITSKFTAEELITKREEVRLEIKVVLEERLRARNIIVEEVSIVNFDFSESFNAAIENKVTMAQNALAAQNKLEQIKFEAQQTEAIAIGQKNAKIATAQGDAEAIRIIDEQLKTSPTYTEYLKVQRWNGILPQVTGGAIPLISVS